MVKYLRIMKSAYRSHHRNGQIPPYHEVWVRQSSLGRSNTHGIIVVGAVLCGGWWSVRTSALRALLSEAGVCMRSEREMRKREFVRKEQTVHCELKQQEMQLN